MTSHVYLLAFLGHASVLSRGDCGVHWDVDVMTMFCFHASDPMELPVYWHPPSHPSSRCSPMWGDHQHR